jgi:benzodiazapine receptor
MNLNEIIKLLLCIGICEFAGIIGRFFTAPKIPTWYKNLRKPSFNPPNWIFAPVWTILYFLMGVSLYLVVINPISFSGKLLGFLLFFIQLLLNSSWSIVFFGKNSLRGSFVVIVLLWIFILLTIGSFFFISKIAAVLLIPYFLWVSFASVLNFSIYKLNTSGN